MKMTAVFAVFFTAAAWAAIEIIPSPATNPPGTDASGGAPASPEQDPAAPAGPAGAGVLELLNGDRLTGTWERMDASTGLISFRHESLREPADVATIGLRRFKASRRGTGTQAPASNWAVTLTNGDLMRGNVVALDDKTLELDTWYSGRVKIDRALVQSTAHTSAMGTIFEGPGDPEGWTNTKGKPRFSNEDIHLGNNAIVGRELDRMPPKSRIDFEVRWFAYCYFLVAFYADKPTLQDGANGCYMFSLQGNSRIELNRVTPNSGQRRIGQTNLQGLENESQQYVARFSIFTDVAQKKILVYMNGAQVADWTDSQVFDGKGKAIAFCSSQGNPLLVRNIRVSEWDGRTPDSGKEASGVGTAETLSLNNGDQLSGDLKSLSGETARVETSFGALEIPVDRINLITFAKNEARARRNRGDMRLALWDDTIVTLDIARLADGSFEGSSENMGSMRLPLSGVRSAEWNLYGRREPEDKQEEEAGPEVMFPIAL
ncbi:MAG: hypothetical protein KBA51_00785 [Kiritimatiellae bacterium]|nr:hypothetical protein [Kiritimatiellia bacterium]